MLLDHAAQITLQYRCSLVPKGPNRLNRRQLFPIFDLPSHDCRADPELTTRTRPSSLAPFLARLSFAQIQLIQTIRVYSSESVSTWLIPVKDLANINHLAGLRCLQVFLQIKPYAVDQYFDVDPEDRAHSQFASLGMFKGPSLNEVDVMIVTPEWKNVDADELSEATVEGVAKWQGEIRDILL